MHWPDIMIHNFILCTYCRKSSIQLRCKGNATHKKKNLQQKIQQPQDLDSFADPGLATPLLLFSIERICIGYTLKARWLSDLFNRVPKTRGE